MRKILLVLLSSILLVGCTSNSTYINMEGTEKNIEFKGFVKICEEPINLVYDSLTSIVYIRNRAYPSNYVYTPYYASNGLPYLYNSSTNTLEINEDK